MRTFFTYLLIIALCHVNAQTTAPGGIQNPFLWHIAERDGFFDASANTFSVPLPSGRSHAFTVFIVYKHHQTDGEQTVWTVDGEAGTSLVMTTRRLGDLQHFGYINYAFENEPQFRIFTYTHSEPADTENRLSENLTFSIGRRPSDQNIPVVNFRGYIPEIIVYNRVLNPRERQRVESYLAIKYGISLSQVFPTSYLNSSGTVVWNAERERRFNHNITAIGRDDGSGLLQTSSTSSREPELLRMNLLQRELPNNEFLFWADNGGGLHFARQYGNWKRTGKTWRLQKTSAIQGLSIEQNFDLTNISNRFLSEGDHFALMIDHTGTGNFPVGKVSFIKAARTGSTLQFSGIDWSRDTAGSVFALAIIPEDFQYNYTNCVGCNDDFLLADHNTNSNFSNLHLYPNPTSDGTFWLDIVLYQEADVNVRIYTIAGVLVSQRTLRGSKYYLYRGNLPHAGTYVVRLISKGTSESLQVIRK
jgi:hypothetical protein